MSAEKAASNDFMALEPHLVELARAAGQGLRPVVHVLTSTDLADVKESMQKHPAIHIIHRGFRPVQTRSDGLVTQLRNTWMVVAVSKSSHGQQTARAEAGKLLAHVAARMSACRLPNTAGPLTIADSPPAWGGAGFQYVPLAFSVDTFFHAIY